MSGVCSKHKHHEPGCKMCRILPSSFNSILGIDDVIAKYTATDKGKKAMQKAEEDMEGLGSDEAEKRQIDAGLDGMGKEKRFTLQKTFTFEQIGKWWKKLTGGSDDKDDSSNNFPLGYS